MNEKPKHFKKFKIIGFIGIALGMIGVILAINGFSNDEIGSFMLGGFMTCFGFFVGIACLVLGFRPELSKLGIKSAKYIQNENKDDLKDMASTSADIVGDAVTEITRSIKKGLADEDKMYCKHCGELIDADSRFCNRCGKEQ